METIHILQNPNNSQGRWQPIVGNETIQLLARFNIPESEKERIQREAVSILSKCVPPSGPCDSVTGLVVGYVQSGKTMSFTTVTALARDNGYPLVIVVAGTSKPLLAQSTNRLKSDLAIDNRTDRAWQLLETRNIRRKSSINELARDINNTLLDWQDPNVPANQRRTILVTAMKQYQHLNKLRQVLERVDLITKTPALIIDDEADQRSLNTKVKQGEMSTTYQSIVALRNVIPHLSFLQYTATPQAPLLINLIDVLSPQFAEVLMPGDGYIGGKTYFIEHPLLVAEIPSDEIPTKDNVLDGPPESLLHALRIYYLGVAAGLAKNGGEGNRSMLVHPSHKTIPHKQYYEWIAKVTRRWQQTMELDDNDPDRLELISEFQVAYSELAKTEPQLPELEILVNYLRRAFRRTHLKEINSREGPTETVDWQNEYGHILVGGQAMDRGFTVEGLTVTYMPRGVGLSLADTIQQRARFFGYKRSYLGFCRIFLDTSVREAFCKYVLHEEDIRKRLVDHAATGRTLTEWKRAFFLDRHLKPTRDGVIDLDYIRGSVGDNWFAPKAPHDSVDAARFNLAIIRDFISNYRFEEDAGHPDRTDDQRHLIATDIPLGAAYEKLLVQLKVTRYLDSERFTGFLLQIKDYLDRYPNAVCTVIQIKRGGLRYRNTDATDCIPNLLQGRNPKSGSIIYPGDRKIVSASDLTIQIHMLQVDSKNNGVLTDIPAVVLHIPDKMRKDWLVQRQPTE